MNWHLVPIETKPFARALSLVKGDRVLLCFAAGDEKPGHHLGKADDEFVWAEVMSKIEETYAGAVVTQRPATLGIAPWDIVHFEARHVHHFGARTSWLKRVIRRISGRSP